MLSCEMWLVLQYMQRNSKKKQRGGGGGGGGGGGQLVTDMQWTITDLVYVAIPDVAAVKVGLCFDNWLHIHDIRDTETEQGRETVLKPLIKLHSVIQIWTFLYKNVGFCIFVTPVLLIK